MRPLGRSYLTLYIIAKPYSLEVTFHIHTLIHTCACRYIHIYTCIYTYTEKISTVELERASGYIITSLVQMTNINSTLMDSSSVKHTKDRYRSLDYFHKSVLF